MENVTYNDTVRRTGKGNPGVSNVEHGVQASKGIPERGREGGETSEHGQFQSGSQDDDESGSRGGASQQYTDHGSVSGETRGTSDNTGIDAPLEPNPG